MPSENVASSRTGSSDRRTRKREQRRDALLDLAADLVDSSGVDGVTMAALAERADYAPASLYTYFPSRSALLAALQQRALHTLAAVARDERRRWDVALAEHVVDAPSAALAELMAFSELFLRAPQTHAREFRLQQELLVAPDAEDPEDAASVVPSAMAVLEMPRALLDAAVDVGALAAASDHVDPIGAPLPGNLLRTFAWITALNGALLVDGLSTGLPSTGHALGTELTTTLLRGWGAEATALDAADALARELLHADPTTEGTRR